MCEDTDDVSRVLASGTNVYVTFVERKTGNDEIFFNRSTNNGGTIQPIVQISNNAKISLIPMVTTVGANVYVTWQDATPGKYDIFDIRSDDNGSTWKAIQNLSNNAGTSTHGQIDG
jgi:hypothetical protein